MEALHIRHGLVDPTDRRWVADGPFCPIPWAQVRAMDTPDTNLAGNKLLGSLRMPCRNILFCRCKDFDHFGADITLSIGQAIAVGGHSQQHALLRLVVGVVVPGYRSRTLTSIVSAVSTMVPWRSLVSMVTAMTMMLVMMRLVRVMGEWWQWWSTRRTPHGLPRRDWWTSHLLRSMVQSTKSAATATTGWGAIVMWDRTT